MPRWPAAGVLLAGVTTLACGAGLRLLARQDTASSGAPAREAAGPAVRDPAWSPDGARLAVSIGDRIHVITPEGSGGAPLTAWEPGDILEREPAWSPDGRQIAFTADTGGGFDLYVVAASGGAPRRVTQLGGDERKPSWTRDGRVVFAHRDGAQWDLLTVVPGDGAGGEPAAPQHVTSSPEDELAPAVSPDGRRIVFASSRDNDDGDLDLWTLPLPEPGAPPLAETRGEDAPGGPADRRQPRRVLRARGDDDRPAWAPAGDRVVFRALREGVASLWVAQVDPPPDEDGTVARARPPAPPVLISRRGGTASWSPDGRTIAVADLPPPEPIYNGNPARDEREAPTVFGGAGDFGLRLLPAPRVADGGARAVAASVRTPAERQLAVFDRVWDTLARLYYGAGPAAEAWRGLRAKYRPLAGRAGSDADLERVLDRMVAEQPLIKPAVTSSGVVVVSGHRLASEAGRRALELGGNVVDAAIAVSFALGVVEPEASGIGGDGMALVHLRGMEQPVVVDYKDQAPSHATLDNARIFEDGRLVADGPAAANIPGVVAGLDLLYRRYASGKVRWADLVAPAIALAEEGFVLDAALPTSLAEGRGHLAKHAEARRIYLPGDRVPQPGDRFVNADYGATLRAIATEGAATFYRGEVARRIARDLAARGGIITFDDLAQYRAIERTPLAGRFREHTVFAAPPPVATGAALLETLQILDGYAARPGARYAEDADYLHHLIEAWKVRDANRPIADPALWPVDLGDHLSTAHAAQLFRTIDPRHAGRYVTERDERDDAQDESGQRIGRGTTAFVVADASGDMIAVTQTLSTWGGNFYVSEGLGFLYNNHLRGNRTTRGAYGHLLPLLRSSSASTPTLVFRDDGGRSSPLLAVGAAGNAWIPASVYGVISGVVDGGLGAQRAVEAPRFLVSRDPADPRGTAARVQIEDRFPRSLLDDLAARGHVFQKIGRKGEVRYGYAAAARLDTARGEVEGGAEPRRSHAAVAWEGGSRPAGAQPQGGRP